MKQGKLAETASWIRGLPLGSVLILPGVNPTHPAIAPMLAPRPDLQVVVGHPAPFPWPVR